MQRGCCGSAERLPAPAPSSCRAVAGERTAVLCCAVHDVCACGRAAPLMCSPPPARVRVCSHRRGCVSYRRERREEEGARPMRLVARTLGCMRLIHALDACALGFGVMHAGVALLNPIRPRPAAAATRSPSRSRLRVLSGIPTHSDCDGAVYLRVQAGCQTLSDRAHTHASSLLQGTAPGSCCITTLCQRANALRCILPPRSASPPTSCLTSTQYSVYASIRIRMPRSGVPLACMCEQAGLPHSWAHAAFSCPLASTYLSTFTFTCVAHVA